MKRYLRNGIVCALVLTVAVLAACFGVRYALPLIKDTTTVTDTTAPTTAVTTTAATTVPTTVPTTESPTLIDINEITVIDLFPLSLAGGDWDVKHCQGIAVDKDKGYIYYSYTTLLVKCDWEGNIVGTVTGFEGHLGDITFNEEDRKIYCGYYAEGRQGIYAVIFNADKITENDMSATDKNIVRTVHLQEPWKDYSADLDGDGKLTWENDHRYGCSGIDGVAFGPSFINSKKTNYFTVAYGIYPDAQRTDNDYQVLVQYDVTDWWTEYAKPYSSTTFHRSGPESHNGKYFVYTGHTTYGVQTIEYFDELNLWLLNCYKGTKEQFNPYTMFAIDGDVKPVKQELKGQSKTVKGWVLSLYQDGEYDSKNDIYGWYSSYGTQGMAYLYDGLFYIVRPYQSWTGTKTAICYLNVWNPKQATPFSLAAGIGNDFSISKKPRIETTVPETTTKADETQAGSTGNGLLNGILSAFS